MRSTHPLVWVLGFAALIVNPAVACGPSAAEDPYDYDESDMLVAVRGTWRLTFARPEGMSVILFSLDKGRAIGPSETGELAAPQVRRPQCGNRTFTRPAGACISTSELVLTATITSAEPPLATRAGSGSFYVRSLKYYGGHLELRLGADLRVTADLDDANAVKQSSVVWQGQASPATLEREAN